MENGNDKPPEKPPGELPPVRPPKAPVPPPSPVTTAPATPAASAAGTSPRAPASSAAPQKSSSPGTKTQAPRPTGGPKKRNPQVDGPLVTKYGQQKKPRREMMYMPFVFVAFMFGLVNMGLAPIVYIYEVLAYNKKNEWPGWSGLDGLNYEFFTDHPLFERQGVLIHTTRPPTYVFNTHIASVDHLLNTVATEYLSWSIVFILFLQGVTFLSLSVRISIRALGEKD